MPSTCLDTALIARRRIELGLSQRALSAECGFSNVTISLLESGRNHEELTIRKLGQLANALGLPIGVLFADARCEERKPANDDRVLEALLAEARQALGRGQIAVTLGWALDRVEAALEELADRLGSTGVLLHRASSGFTLRPRSELLSGKQRQELERLRMRTRQLRAPGMRILLAAVRGELPSDWDRLAGNSDRVNMSMLVNAGVLEGPKSGYQPTADLRRSLGV